MGSATQDLWTTRGLIKVESTSHMLNRITSTSNPAEWAMKGREYFSHKLYKLAATCFQEADQEFNMKLSLAYYRMSRAKLKQLCEDTPDARADLLAAADELETCADISGSGNASNVYHHAATCYATAGCLVPAATAFIKAGRYSHGVQILFDEHEFYHGAKALIDNREHLDAGFCDSLREEARRYCFNRREYSPLHLLFDTVDETLAYARDHDFKAQWKDILNSHERYEELAEEYLKEGNLNRAAGFYMLAYWHHRTRSSIRQAVSRLRAYIESVLPVQGTYSKATLKNSKLLIDLVNPFAIQSAVGSRLTADLFYAYLRLEQAGTQSVASRNPKGSRWQLPRGALSCYLAIKKTTWFQHDSMNVILGYLAAWESFKTAILNISDRPLKLLGITLLDPEGDATFSSIPECLPLHPGNRNPANSNQTDSEALGNTIGTSIDEDLPKRVHMMLGSLLADALASRWTQAQYSDSDLHSHLSNPSNKSTISFAPKMRVLCKILSVLDMSAQIKQHPDHSLVDQLCLRRMFALVYPANGTIEDLSELRTVPESNDISECLRSWLQQDWDQLRNSEVSDTTITHLLLHSIMRSALYIEFIEDKPFDMQLKQVGNTFNQQLVMPLRGFFSMERRDRFMKANQFIEWVLGQNYRVDAAVMLHFVEMLTREMIIHMYTDVAPDFYKALMPLSWIRSLARKYPPFSSLPNLPPLGKFLLLVRRLSLELRFGLPGRWHIEGKQGSTAMVDMLNLRLCWCVAFVIQRLGEADEAMKLAIETLARLTSDDMPDQYSHRHMTITGRYHEFSKVKNKDTCLKALCRTFRHETLILILENKYTGHIARYAPSVRTLISPQRCRLEKVLEFFDKYGYSPFEQVRSDSWRVVGDDDDDDDDEDNDENWQDEEDEGE